MVTMQEAYDTIVEYFSRPKAALSKSVSSKYGNPDQCWYRHPDDGRKCAVGCLIPDSEYRESMEGKSADRLVWTFENFDNQSVDFVCKAQENHDDAKGVSEFLSSIRDLGQYFGLKV